MPKIYFFTLLLLLMAGCTVFTVHHQFNATQENSATAEQAEYYEASVRPILETRCTVCHGCYDAPCQLKMDATAGVLRGAHKDKVYDGTRLLSAHMSRLFEDAHSTSEWREKDFFSVVDGDPGQPKSPGVMEQLLHLKQQHPLPAQYPLPESFDFSIKRDQQCPQPEEFANYRENYPLWGMPYGLPALTENEHQTLVNWLQTGGIAASMTLHSSPALAAEIERWETFFNGDSLKSQLVNRYLYEHLFLASLWFEQAPGQAFKLVRSHTPPGQPIDRISTRRPFDDPKAPRVYYRLWHDPSTTLAKTRMPYALNNKRMENWQQWFYQAEYNVRKLPGYATKVASNPFLSFAQLPVDSRYRFLLDEAEFSIMNFIKGPVCRGQVALNVIRDHFWVFFIDPDQLDMRDNAQFLQENIDHLALPAEVGSTFMPVTYWLEYANRQKAYLEARAKYLNQQLAQQPSLNLSIIWNGGGTNDNAALTIFRHNDSASVTRGLIGPHPKTGWVIDYSLLERIHYLLVAGFDVYGNVSHQLLSRLYMDFLRIEGEMNLVALLPKGVQDQHIHHWYRGAEDEIEDYLEHYLDRLPPLNIIDYQTDAPLAELFTTLQSRLAPSFASSPYVQQLGWPDTLQEPFTKLQSIHGKAASLMSESSLIWVPKKGVFSLLRTSAHSNLSSLFQESKRRLPDEDKLVITGGVVGAYPNTFWMLDESSWDEFAQQIVSLNTEADYQKLRQRFGVNRADPNFWQISDAIHQAYRQHQPQRAGLLDFNRLENR
ncbi:fatty acid cis/trans isomerase [Gilvimarinus sp. 1_MG-2023]|uniref:fatty acid cis/trans isomerase n=1 Tax=Gilvimarinus sp. 1_MG-2023 TaxID=3062638 RepID=UPI0026E26068|nr:fatty acid cis/trans isomerase [Gilvimarinus sp. 1_MG-2023]MDO6746313.1 fatty acid cis/trans isomerase [Gilvimarinus sp. 1_MG-2023]